MEDSATMTIDFLRARLLSERSVSKTARQRADELARRVVELEEQLKIVTIQRKNAEMAAVEVLAILENNGTSDFSEVFNSSSDQEVVRCESKEGNNFMKEEECSVTSRQRKNEVEELSALDLEGSPLPGRSLSWKGCTDGSNPLEKNKYINQARRRQTSFVSTGESSTKPLLGKSCRQIKRRETRSAVDEVGDESLLPDAQENGVTTGSGDSSNCFKDRPEILEGGCKNEEEKVFLEGQVPVSEGDQRKETDDGHYVSGGGRDADMERALKNQAQLIDRYEAEENAQREWEEKFRESNSFTPDSFEHGKQSDVTEERDEIEETAGPADTILSHGHSAKSEAEAACHNGEAVAKTLPNGIPSTSCLDMGCSQDQQCNSTSVNESQTGFPEFSFKGQENLGSPARGKQKQEWSETPSGGSSEHQSVQKFSSFHEDGSLYKGESSGSQNILQASMQHETPNGLGGVLEALQCAKLSLKHELNRFPLSTKARPVVRATKPLVLAMKARNAMEIPVGCVGLFRVPTDSQFIATPQANLLGPYSDAGLSLTRYYPDVGNGVAARDRYTTSPNMELVLRNSTRKPCIDPYLDMGMALPAVNRYTYPSYADLMLRMASNDGFPRPYPSIGLRMPVGDCNTFSYNDQIRSNMLNR